MDYIQKIFERAKIKNVIDHLLYGHDPDTDITDYESRMEKAFARYGDIVAKYDPNPNSELYDAANALTEVISAVYMEIGFQTGLLFMQKFIIMVKNTEERLRMIGSNRFDETDVLKRYK